MPLKRGFGAKTINNRNPLNNGPKTFWLPGGTETTVVLLDDNPAECVRHCQYLKGDMKGNNMRVTCAGMNPETDPDAVPTKCLICNAALRSDRIARKHYIYLTLIDERSFEYKGDTFKDMKRLLELTPSQAELFIRRREAAGTLVGAQFKVYRSKDKRAARHGDEWNFLGFVWNREQNEPPQQGLMRHFWKSPAIPNIRKSADQRNANGQVQPMSWQEAVQSLTKPYDYEDIMGKYDPKAAAAFVAYHAQAIGMPGLGGQQGTAPDAGIPPAADPSGAPPYPGGGMPPAQPAAAPPDYSTAPPAMPTGSAPAMAPAAAAPPMQTPSADIAPPWNGAPDPNHPSMQQHAAPPAAAAPPPMAAPPAMAPPPQPAVPDPTSAGGPGFGGAPAFPGAAVFPGAAPATASAPAAAGTPVDAPAYAPPAAQTAPGAGYNFSNPPAAAAPPAQPAVPAAAAPPPFPSAQGMTGGPGQAAPPEPFGI